MLRITVDADGTDTVVAVAGELDLETSPELRASLDPLGATVVVDLADVTFLDSSAMGALVATQKRLTRDGGRLRLRAPRDNVRGALEVAGLASFFEAT